MNLLKIVFRPVVFVVTLALILASGCALQSPLDLNLHEAISQDIFGKMSSDEVVFMKSTLFSNNAHTKGSIAWLEKSFPQYLKANKNVKITSNATLVVFFYPVSQLPPDCKTGVIFANVDRVQGPNSADHFTQWVNIARLPSEERGLPQVSCRLMFWFSPKSQGIESERLLEVVEEFELKKGHWRLLRVRRNSAK